MTRFKPIVVFCGIIVLLLGASAVYWRVHALRPKQVTSSGRDSAAKWSPDGRTIAFAHQLDPPDTPFYHHCPLWVMNADGSQQRELISTNMPAFAHFRDLCANNYDWLPDGQSVICRLRGRIHGKKDETPIPDGLGYWQVWLDGRVRRLTSAKSKQHNGGDHFRLSPDGKWLAYVLYLMPQKKFAVNLMSLDDNPQTRKLFDIRKVPYFCWEPDAQTLRYAKFEGGPGEFSQAFEIFAYDLKTDTHRKIMDKRWALSYFDLSPDGQQLVYGVVETIRQKERQVTYLASRDFSQPRLFEGWSSVWWLPSGDGLLVALDETAFFENGVHRQRFWVTDCMGKVRKRLMTDAVGPPSFAPDGNRYVMGLDGNLYLDRVR